jgi:hypothetical protein
MQHTALENMLLGLVETAERLRQASPQEAAHWRKQIENAATSRSEHTVAANAESQEATR